MPPVASIRIDTILKSPLLCTRSNLPNLRPWLRNQAPHKRNSRRADLGLPKHIYQVVRSLMGDRSEFVVAPDQKWWDASTTAIVTGANKGIGKAAAEMLAQNGLQTIVAARDESRGVQAVEELKKTTGSLNIAFEQLDISDAISVRSFAERIQNKYSNVAILINNAGKMVGGIAFKGNIFGAEEAQTTLDTNFLGTKAVCEALAPIMDEGARIVNVCSMAGKQRIIKDPALLRRFKEANSAADVEKLAAEFVEGIKSGTYSSHGWPGSMYGVSKLCEATYTRVLAEKVRSGVDVNACCPGYVDTDMSSHRGIKTPAQGADTPVWLALLAPKGTTGKFFSDRKEEPF